MINCQYSLLQIQLVDDTVGTHGSGLAEQVRINGVAVGPIIVVISTKSVALGVLLHGECIGASDGQLAVIKYRYSWIVFEADVCRYDQFTLYVDNVCFIIQRTDDGECIPARSEFVAIYGPEGDDKFRMRFVYIIQDVLVIVQGRRDGSQAGDFLYIIAFIKWVVTVG